MTENRKSLSAMLTSEPFGLTEQDVLDIIKKSKKEIQGLEEPSDDYSEVVQKSFQQLSTQYKRQLEALTSDEPSDILQGVKNMHERAKDLVLLGLDEVDVIRQINEEYPDTTTLYGLLRLQPWGYRLGQRLLVAKQLSELENRP